MAETPGLRDRPLAYGTAALGFAILIDYLAEVVIPQGAALFDVLPWAVLMAVAAVAAFSAAQARNRRLARNLMAAAGGLFLLLAWVGILGIGVGFLLASVMAAFAAVRISSRPRRLTPNTLIAASVVLVSAGWLTVYGARWVGVGFLAAGSAVLVAGVLSGSTTPGRHLPH